MPRIGPSLMINSSDSQVDKNKTLLCMNVYFQPDITLCVCQPAIKAKAIKSAVPVLDVCGCQAEEGTDLPQNECVR